MSSVQPPHGYRPDVDGLRALAVSLVVAFHAFPDLVPGGFVGVDIFFVISGFLITGVIWDQYQIGKFTILDFYQRRIRRIFPALLLVSFALYGYGYFLMYPEELSRLSLHLTGGSTFISNFLYWNESGYFDRAAETKPLLHLWSLAVEEQFYFFWPLILLIVLRKCKSWALLITFCLGLASFLYGLHALGHDRSGAYFSPLSRFWEIWAGALLAVWSRRVQTQGGAPFKQWVPPAGLAGLALIVGATYLINRWKAFPGAWALLPVLGAFLLIAAGPTTPLSRLLLQRRALVGLGLISYPLYLWHWPLLVLSDLEFPATAAPVRHMWAVAIALVLSMLTYHWLEKPLKKAGPRGVIVMTVLMIVLGALSWVTHRSGGLPQRLDAATAALHTRQLSDLNWVDTDTSCITAFNLSHWAEKRQQVFCRQSGSPQTAQIALLGDSTANALFPGTVALAAALKADVVNIGNGSCLPAWGVRGAADWNRSCEDINAKARQFVMTTGSVQTVVLSWASWDWSHWRWPVTRSSESTALPGLDEQKRAAELLKRTVAELTDAGKRVILIVDTPSMPADPETCLPRLSGQARPSCTFTEAQLKDRQPNLRIWQDILQSVKGPGVCIASLSDAMQRQLGGYRLMGDDQRLWFRDGHHLSEHGSLKLVQDLDRQCSLFQPRASKAPAKS
jgi:peptidoglycan/LPS O-acetylase OafA/YrhL